VSDRLGDGDAPHQFHDKGVGRPVLDEAGLSSGVVADQLGHSRTSMTQDFYLGRRSVDSQAALALDAALRDTLAESEDRGKTVE
jgi:integrase